MYEYTPYHPINVGDNPTGVNPRDNDILCGRGSTLYKHAGNKNFRFIVSVHLPKYTDPLSTRKEKGIMIQKIVNDLHSEGRRFLKEGINGWFILSHKEAKYKVGHALRDAASEMKKHMKKYNEKKAKSKGSGKKKATATENNDSSSIANNITDSAKDEVVSSSINDISPEECNQKNAVMSEQPKAAPLISTMSHVISEEEDNASINSGGDDSWFESFFHSLSPTLFDDNEHDPWAKEEESTLVDTLTFDESLFS